MHDTLKSVHHPRPNYKYPGLAVLRDTFGQAILLSVSPFDNTQIQIINRSVVNNRLLE